MAATTARGESAVSGLTVVDRNEGRPGASARGGTGLGRARDVAVVSLIAVTQLVWMAALAYVLISLLL